MKKISVWELKKDFSKALKSINAEKEVVITYGRKIEIKALLVPKETKKHQRKLGILKATAIFIGGHNTTEEEFGM